MKVQIVSDITEIIFQVDVIYGLNCNNIYERKQIICEVFYKIQGEVL